MILMDSNNLDLIWKERFEIEMAEIKYYYQKYSSLDSGPKEVVQENKPQNIERIANNRSRHETAWDHPHHEDEYNHCRIQLG